MIEQDQTLPRSLFIEAIEEGILSAREALTEDQCADLRLYAQEADEGICNIYYLNSRRCGCPLVNIGALDYFGGLPSDVHPAVRDFVQGYDGTLSRHFDSKAIVYFKVIG